MIPFVLSVTFGAGVLLLYEGLTAPRRPDGPSTGSPTLWRAWEGRVEAFLVRAGLSEVTARDFVLFSLGSGGAAALLVQLFLGWGAVALLAGAAGLVAPFAYYVQRHDRRRAALQAALADAIGQLRDSIRTGMSVQDGLRGLAEHGPAALRPEFARLVREARLDGFERALEAARERLADPVFDLVAAGLALNDHVGGRHVSQVLDRLAHATRAQLRVEAELRAHQARTVLSARVVAALPLVVLAAIRRVNPSYVALFDSGWGQLLLAGCAASVAVGYGAMLWLTRLPGDERVLGGDDGPQRTGDAGDAGAAAGSVHR